MDRYLQSSGGRINETVFRHTGRDWLLLLLDSADADTRAKILLLLWRAWHLRNDIIHQKGEATVSSSVSFLQAYRHDSTSILPLGNNKGKMPRSLSPINMNTPETSFTGTWTAPDPGWIKLNVDGSFTSKETAGGAGVVARDSAGAVLFGACRPLDGCEDAEETEAHVALLGIKLILDRRPCKVLLETDCYAVANALRSKEQNRSRLWHIYEETKNLMCLLPSCTVLQTKREGNRVADGLAKLARTFGDHVFSDGLCSPVREFVISDCKTHDSI